MILCKAITYHLRDYFSVLWSIFENKQFSNTFSPLLVLFMMSPASLWFLKCMLFSVCRLHFQQSCIRGSSENLRRRRQGLTSLAECEQYRWCCMGNGVCEEKYAQLSNRCSQQTIQSEKEKHSEPAIDFPPQLKVLLRGLLLSYSPYVLWVPHCSLVKQEGSSFSWASEWFFCFLFCINYIFPHFGWASDWGGQHQVSPLHSDCFLRRSPTLWELRQALAHRHGLRLPSRCGTWIKPMTRWWVCVVQIGTNRIFFRVFPIFKDLM